jgi:ubiquitin-conjugating enzyme (huntingtin interacting protein 2)
MSSSRSRRVSKEIADIHSDIHSKIIVDPINGDDLTHLRGQFTGPPDTAYEGGKFFVDIVIPPEYPFRPPIMKFETKIWHPNVSSQTVRLYRTFRLAWQKQKANGTPFCVICS